MSTSRGSTGGVISAREQEERAAKNLKLATFFFVTVLVIGLGVLGWLGWRETERAVTLLHSTPLSSLTATVAPQTTPTVSPSFTPTPTSPPLDKETARSSASQDFIILALFAAIAVLFPAILALAFAFQQVQRLAKDLLSDLGKLGFTIEIAVDPLQVEQDELNKLSGVIQKGFNQEVEKSHPPEDLARQYAATSLSVASTGTGSGQTHFLDLQDDPTFDQGIWNKAQDISLSGNQKIQAAWQQWENEKQNIVQPLGARFGWLEFLIPLFFLTLFVLASVVWTFWPNGIYGFVTEVAGKSLHIYFSSIVAGMSPALVAVLVAYLVMAYGLVRRYNRSDITPGAYWEVLKRLFVVFLLGLVISVLIKTDPDQVSWANAGAVFFGILAGAFPVGTLGILVRGAQALIQGGLHKWVKGQVEGKDIQWGEDLAHKLYPQHDISLLDDLDQWDALRIKEEGVIGIQGMAEADISHLVTWLPFPTSQIVDWMDQAILRLAAGAEPEISYIKTLRAIGLRGASDLVDATKDEAGKLMVVLAAQAVQATVGEDPMPLAQLAALRAQLKVKAAQDKVDKVKGKTKANSDNLDGIAPALAAVRDAKTLVDEALKNVKGGGDALKDALDPANSLQAKFKSAGEKADETEKALKAVTDNKVSDDLEKALIALGAKLSGPPDANTQATDLTDALDEIANPLAETVQKAVAFQENAEAISKKAEAAVQPDGAPPEVKQAVDSLASLTSLAEAAQKQINADSSLEEVVVIMDKLVKLLTDEGDEMPKKLLGDEKLNKKEQWTAAISESDKKAKAYEDAQKLMERAQQILAQAREGEKTLLKARSKASAATGGSPPLTPQVLGVILKGLERNPNLRRIQRYLTEETASIAQPREYRSNIDWLR